MRLFVAVPVPEELRLKAALLGKEIAGEGIIPVRPENMHLTLKFIGEVPPQELEGITKALSAVKFSGFRCGLRGVGAFPREDFIRVVWAGCDSGGALEALAKEVLGALKGYGKEERFTAHLTIARVKRKIDLSGFFSKHKGEEFGDFEVPRFALVESVLGGKGPEYRTVAEFGAR